MNKNDLTPPDLTPAPNKIEKSESGDLNSGVTTIGGESLVEITKSGDLTLGVSAIPTWGERKVRTNPRKHGANTGEDLKARGN